MVCAALVLTVWASLCLMIVQVTEWLASPDEVTKMSQAASTLGKVHAKATKEIAREIAELVF